MKRKFVCLIILSITITSCGNVDDKKYSILQAECNALKNEVKILSDSIIILKFSAPDRLHQIDILISEDRLDEAEAQIFELRSLFPSSSESKKSVDYENIIAKKRERKKAEEDRIKALGYKAFKDNTSHSVGNVSFVLSGFTFSKTFTFDYCSDVNEYSYRTADKDNTYLLVSLSLSTKEKNGSCPNFYLYEIDNGDLKKVAFFWEEYASWTSYGAKIGNYSDNSHDFSKVNTIRYKLAAEVGLDQSRKPLLMLIGNDGVEVKDVLTIDDVSRDYIVVKIINRNKI
jgi:hypothetical protein